MSWDMRSNIKPKPGSQGTLFQGSSDQMTDAKWPRHYTPERLHQVREAVAPRQRAFRDDMHEYDTAGETRKLIDNVARSTVPAEHLQRLQFSPGRSASDMLTGSGDVEMTAAGKYNKPLSANPNSVGVIRLLRGAAEDPVAIHEIGHHASHLFGAMTYGSRTEQGREEAKADAYAEEHFRDRRGRPTSYSGYRYVQPDSVRNAEFFAAYHSTRPRPPAHRRQELHPHLPELDARTAYRAGKGRT